MLLTVFTISTLVQIINSQNPTLQVTTTVGEVVGDFVPDRNYYSFYGIHYGGSTAGENRFKSPPPPPTYPGPMSAHDQTIFCAQPTARGIIGTEDCLTVNVFTNATSPAKPVLVWLVGEDYANSVTSNPTPSFRRIVSEGVVVVQMNYRLSVFGFLCLGINEAPGNAGLKDVVQGLKWIKANIAGFGGDPNNIILFGHGSAAAMVDLITVSPSAKGLVNKAITQSGSMLAPWAIAYDPVGYARAFGNLLNHNGINNAELASFLTTKTLSEMNDALNRLEFYNNTVLFAPCIENANLNGTDAFLTIAPVTLLQKGNITDIPYIAGYTDREGTIRADRAASRDWLSKMQANFTWFLPADLNFGDNITNAERAIRDFYFSQRIINMETIEDFLDYQGDTMILTSVIRGARLRAMSSKSEVRLMEFAYKGTMDSDWAFPTIPLSGARHGSLLNFLLDYDLRPVDEPVMTSLIRRFVAFFNTGVPNPATSQATTWSPVTNNTLNYLLYSGSDTANPGTTIYSEEARVSPHTQRMGLWNDIYARYYVPPKSVSSAPGLFGVSLFVMVCQVVVRLF